jgi:hypothetical protein
MALADETIDVPFTGILNEDSSPYVQPIGEFAELRNCYFSRDGELVPRPTLETTATDVGMIPERLATYNGDLFALSAGFASASISAPGPGLYVLEDGTTSTWRKKSELPEYINKRGPLFRDITAETSDGDYAEGVDWDVFAWRHADGTLRCRVINRETGRIEETTLFYSASDVRVTSGGGDGTYVGVFARHMGTIYAWVVNTTTGVVSSYYDVTYAVGLSPRDNNTAYDVCGRGKVSSPGWYIMYRASADYFLVQVDHEMSTVTAGWLSSDGTHASHGDAVAIQWYWDDASDSERVVCVYPEDYGNNTILKYLTYDGELNNLVPSTMAFTASYNTSPRGISVAWSDGAPAIGVSYYTPWYAPNWLESKGRTYYKHLGHTNLISLDRGALTSKLWTEEPTRWVVQDGDCESLVTDAWTAMGGATLSKVAVPEAPTTRALRILHTGTLGGASQQCLTYGKQYRLVGSASAFDGNTIIASNYAGNNILWQSSGVGDWEPFDITFTAQSSRLEFVHYNGFGVGGYAQLDNLRLEPLFDNWLTSGSNRVCGYTLDPDTPVYHLVEFLDAERAATFGTPVRPITTCAYGEADASSRVMVGKLQNITGTPAGTRTCALPVLTAVPVGSNPSQPTEDILTGFDRVTATWAHRDAWQTVEMDNILYIGGGILCEYDGFQCTENGFLMNPSVRNRDSTPGSQLPAGLHACTMTWTYEDVHGRRHESQPAMPYLVQANGTNKYVRYWRPLTLSMRNEKFGTTLATHWNTATNASLYYKSFAFDESRAIVSSSYVTVASWPQRFANYRNFASGTLLCREWTQPSTYRQTLYAPPDGSGELANFPVWGGCTHLCVHSQRLWAASAEYPNRLKFSKELTPGVPVSFYPPDFDVVIPSDVTGMASLGDNLVVFCADSVYLIQGFGPDNRGANGSFTTSRLPSDIGCIDGRSIVVTELGVFYQSVRGMQLLTRNLSNEEVGIPVRNTFTRDVVINAAINVPNEKQVRWVSDHQTFVFDYRGVPRWYVWDYVMPLQCAVVDDVPVVTTNTGATLTETSATAADADTDAYYQAMSWKTGWLSMGKIAEYKRTRKVGFVIKGSADVGVSYEIESSDCALQTGSFSVAQIATASTRSSHTRDWTTLVAPVVNQLARGFRISATTTYEPPAGEDSGGGGGGDDTIGPAPLITFIGLTFDVGVQRGIRRR